MSEPARWPGERSMAEEPLVLTRALREEIVAHAREQAPKECCGMLAGKGRTARRVIRCRNDHPTPEGRYRIATEDLPNVVRIEDAGEDLVAIYHSHPRSQPYPSPIDRAEAHYPDALYVLVSLWAAEPDVHAYRIRDREAVREVPISDR